MRAAARNVQGHALERRQAHGVVYIERNTCRRRALRSTRTGDVCTDEKVISARRSERTVIALPHHRLGATEARELALLLRSGALAHRRRSSNSVPSSESRQDNIDRGVRALVIGLC